MLKITRCQGESIIIGGTLKITIDDINKAKHSKNTTVKLRFAELDRTARTENPQKRPTKKSAFMHLGARSLLRCFTHPFSIFLAKLDVL